MMVRVLVIMIVVRRRIGQAGLLLGSMKGGGRLWCYWRYLRSYRHRRWDKQLQRYKCPLATSKQWSEQLINQVSTNRGPGQGPGSLFRLSQAPELLLGPTHCHASLALFRVLGEGAGGGGWRSISATYLSMIAEPPSMADWICPSTMRSIPRGGRLVGLDILFQWQSKLAVIKRVESWGVFPKK